MNIEEVQQPAESAPVAVYNTRRGPCLSESTRKYLPKRHLVKAATQQWKVFVGRKPTAVERNALNFFTLRSRNVVES